MRVKKDEQKLREEQAEMLAIEPIVKARDFMSASYQKRYDAVEDWIGKYDTPIQWENAGTRPIDRRLRIRLWNEIQECITKGKPRVSMTKIVKGEITPESFSRLLATKVRAAFIFTKPLDHNEIAMTMLEESYVELKKILDLDIICKKSGKPISTLINSKIRIHQILEERVLGAPVQRIQQHSVVENKKSLRSVDDINRDLRLLEGEAPLEASLILEADELKDSQKTESQSSQQSAPPFPGQVQYSDDET